MRRRLACLALVTAVGCPIVGTALAQDNYQFSDPNVENTPQEETMTFEDRRDVNGLKLPFHMTTTAGGRVIDELILDRILVNPEIGKGDFKR